MSKTVYLKIPQCIHLTKPQVKIKDFATIFCKDTTTKNQIENLVFYSFSDTNETKVVVSILALIEKIQNQYSDLSIVNLGESDFILSYDQTQKKKHIMEYCSTVLVCFIAFFGGGYAIMAYNTDINAIGLFSNLSMLILGNAKIGTLLISISYSIGLFLGLITFFNHLGNKKINSDPTPLEIQMRLYEKDVGTTIIKDVSRRGESIDVKE